MKKMIMSALFGALIVSMTSSCMADNQAQIVDFVYERDVQDVLKIIHDDWNCLFNSLHPVYDPEYVLESLIPGEKFLAEGYRKNLKMKVLHEHGLVIGFVTFYEEDFHVGRVQLVSVAQDYKAKGCGRKLTIAALNDLFDAGCTSVLLWTHKENEKVTMYESLGFEEIGLSEDNILWFKEKEIPVDEYMRYTKYTVTKETFKLYAE